MEVSVGVGVIGRAKKGEEEGEEGEDADTEEGKKSDSSVAAAFASLSLSPPFNAPPKVSEPPEVNAADW